MCMHVNLFVYFQTDDIIAINKPYGLPVHCKYMNERPGLFFRGLEGRVGVVSIYISSCLGVGVLLLLQTLILLRRKKKKET